MNRIPKIADYGLLAVVLFVMARWTWLTWPDPTIDFGRELYVPWRLSEGALLYRDIAYQNGPLSPHFNALLFRVFGAGLHVLFACNGILLIIMLLLVYAWCRKLGGRMGALTASTAFLLLFAFGRFLPYGNYNWMAPYSHEMTHGLLLSAAGLLWLTAIRPRAAACVVGSGIMAGLVFLTKCEIFFALAVSMLFLVALRAWTTSEKRRVMTELFLLCGGFSIPLLAAFLLLRTVMPAAEAAAAISGAWRYVFASEGLSATFFRTYMGTDAVGVSLAYMAGVALGVGSLLLLVGALAWRFFQRPGSAGRIPVVLFFLVTGGGLFLAGRILELDLAFLGLPVWVLVILAVTIGSLRAASDEDTRERRLATCAFASFSLLMLVKMALNAQIIHYGFVLALPATVLCICAVMDRIPAWLRARSSDAARVCTAGFAGLFAGLAVWFLLIMNHHLAAQTSAVGWGGDVFRADERGASIQQAAERLRALLEPSDTLWVVPESEWLNYLLRAQNPTPFGNFNPHQLKIFGEERVVAALDRAPPAYVVWVDRIYDEYGVNYFGKDYGRLLARRLMEQYEWMESLAPGSRLLEARMPILLFRRRSKTVHHSP